MESNKIKLDDLNNLNDLKVATKIYLDIKRIGALMKILNKSKLNLKNELIEYCKNVFEIESTNTSQLLYHFYYNLDKIKCYCGNNLTFLSVANGYNKFCSNSCAQLAPEIQKKKKETFLKNYGVDHPFKNGDVLKKVKTTNLERYDSEWYTNSYDFKNRSSETCLKNHGVEYYFQVFNMVDVNKKACLKKYGVDTTMHVDYIAQKCFNNAYKSKEYNLPSGKIIKIRGYEPFIMDELFRLGYKEDDIISSVSEIHKLCNGCFYYNDENGKKHRYYPDLYIKSDNKIIEVKSDYTYQCNLKINLLKKQSILDNGINFETWIYDPNTKTVKIM